MRAIGTAILAAAALTLAQRATAAEGPWCTVTNLPGGNAYWDCQYRSFDDCYRHMMAGRTLGGRGFCNENPRYEGPQPAPRRGRSR